MARLSVTTPHGYIRGLLRTSRGVYNAFGETMVMGHAVDLQVFDTDDPVRVDDLVAFLVGEILPPPSNPLMHTGYSLTVFAAFWCPFGKPGMLALDFGKGLFFFPKEAGVVDFFTGREGSERLESHINAHLFGAFWQAFRFALHREADVPLARGRAMDSTRFHLATGGAMVDHLDATNLGEAHPIIVRDTEPALRKRETVITSPALKAWEPRVGSPLFAAAEERLECQVNTYLDDSTNCSSVKQSSACGQRGLHPRG